MPHILIVDDDRETVESLAELAKADGFTVAKADCLRSARAHLVRQPPDVLLTDLQLPDGEGTSLVADLEQPENTEVVVFTGHASMESAIRALRAGATDYLLKPIDIARLKSILDRVPRSQDLHAEIGELRDELRKLGRFGHILGNSPTMQQLYEQLARVSPTSATVLLVGESGTGKELCAQTIHEMSRRKRHPFLPVNCGAVSPQLIESELFGHEKGSFTGADRQHKGFFERANGGTIFLDEITEMPMDLQVKLLRVLETGTFMRVGTSTPLATDVRIIAATNRSPEKAVTDGRLREDLYHRLNVFPVNIPPLRERGTDIELLAQYFLDQHNREQGTKKTFSRAAIAKLYSHTWPGNVRELKNYVQRAFILSDTVIEPDMATSNFVEPDNAEVLTVRIGTPLEEIERRVTFATLASCGNVKRRAAEILGISLKTLYNRLEAYAKAGASVPGEPAQGTSSSAENRAASMSAPLSAAPGYAQPGTAPAATPGMPHPG
jgi:two-component system, NtrC family, response regulator AtoC